jgi:RimJ/RimL family protein N-acetyltransferase
MDPERDASYFYEMNLDPEVLKYTGDLPFKSLEESKGFIEKYVLLYEEVGFARWTVESRETREYLGFCGLKEQDENLIDLGFRLMKKHWGLGYASEAALASLEFGFHELMLPEIIGRVARDNQRSIHVLEKCGFSYWKTDICDGIPNSLFYKLQANNFKKG